MMTSIRCACVTMLAAASLSFAAIIPTTVPSTSPSTQPAADAQKKFPTPAELIEKLKQRRAAEATKTKIAYINLDDPITEKPASLSLFGESDQRTLHDVIDRLHHARDDKDIRGVLITIGTQMQVGLAQAQEIRDALIEIRQTGKKTFVYADSYDTAGYTIATGATNVCLPEGGEIEIPGVGLETMFYKGAFDKLGVDADFVQIGEYKGAEEPYTRTGPSDELRGELNRLTDALYEQVVDGISLERNLPTQAVREMVDDSMMTAKLAKDRGFIDHVVDEDGLRKLLKDELGNEVDLVADYGEPDRPEVDYSNPLALFAALSRRPETSDKPAVAVIYAQGVISDGEADGGLFSEGGVGSDPIRRALRTAARDENIKAIVIRIDSPGGSALASEMMWQAVRYVSQESKKPVIISVGGMAASGGYYLATSGDYIFADPSAIVGSIGVVGGKFVLKDLYNKLGLGTEDFIKGRNADLFSSNAEWTDRQRRMVKDWMQQTYDQFTQRVMATRGGKIKDIDKVARGRIFIAQQARDLGMVDELGGCEKAIAYAANKAGLGNDYDIRTLPAPKTLMEIFSGGHGEEALSPISPKITLSPDSVLLALPPSLRKAAVQELQFAQLLQQRPVVLMSPFVVDTH